MSLVAPGAAAAIGTDAASLLCGCLLPAVTAFGSASAVGSTICCCWYVQEQQVIPVPCSVAGINAVGHACEQQRLTLPCCVSGYGAFGQAHEQQRLTLPCCVSGYAAFGHAHEQQMLTLPCCVQGCGTVITLMSNRSLLCHRP